MEAEQVQYTADLPVRELMVNPKSCLRKTNPDEATLFYVPWLPSAVHQIGENDKSIFDNSTSPYRTPHPFSKFSTVWPFTNEFDPVASLDPDEFSIRLDAHA